MSQGTKNYGWVTNNINPHSNWDDPYNNGYGGRNDYWVPDYDPGPRKRKHEFSPILLVFTTVYDCKHCGARKEDCKTDYCEEQEDFGIGDWG